MAVRNQKAATAKVASLKPDLASVKEQVRIPPPRINTAVFAIRGTAPLVMCKFSTKLQEQLRAKHAEGSSAGNKRKREPKDFKGLFEAAHHRSAEGWVGIPAGAFRAAMITACSLVGFHMTKAKMSVFILADGFEKDDGTPLVRLHGGEPEYTEMITRNADLSPDIRVRPMWREWSCKLRIQWDGDQFSVSDMANLLNRAGMQVGILEGRPYSKKSCGMGWGTFTIAEE